MKINNYKKTQNSNSNSAPNYFPDKKSKQNKDSERKPYSGNLEKKPLESRSDRNSFSGNSGRRPFEHKPDRSSFSGNNERRPFEQKPDRSSFSSGNNERRPFEQRPDRNSFSGNNERRPFEQRPDRNSFSGNNERRPFEQIPDRNSFSGNNERRPFEQRPYRNSFSGNSERRPFEHRPDRNSFSGNSERRPFEQRPDRNSFSGNSERRPFEQRPDRNSFSGNSERRPFEQRPDRNSFSGNSERRPFESRPDRNSFSGNSEKRPFESRPDRNSFLKNSERKSFRYGDGESFSSKRASSFSSDNGNRRQSFERPSQQYSQKKHYTENKYDTKFSNKQENGPENDSMRLNVYISKSGLCSRRAADDIIMKGEITVNGEVVKDLGVKVKKGDTVRHNSKVLYPQEKVYILLNKPKGYTTTVSDPHEKKTVMDLVKGACKERIYPIGRLDKDTIGVLLLTNDGDLAKSLSHPSSMIPKVYRVVLDKPIEREDLKKIREGLILEDGVANVDDIQVDREDPRICGVEIHIGRNRIVRRIFESLGYEVLLLERNLYAGLTRTRVSRGEWRFLTSLEVSNLKRITNKNDS